MPQRRLPITPAARLAHDVPQFTGVMMRLSILAVAVLLCLAATAAADAPAIDSGLQQAIGGGQRSPDFVARDAYRHPGPELAFFDIKSDATVVEIWPAGGYWTEILAPYLREHGTYYVAGPPHGTGNQGTEAAISTFRRKLDADPAVFGKVTVTEFGRGHFDIAPPGSADVVVTFRNLHNWMKGGYAEAALAAFHKALKPGGILGIEDHRGRTDAPQDPEASTGYVRQDYAIALAEKAGFEFLGASEINANPHDTKDWPKGVWTLPPTYALGDQDRAKYAAVGEADNFVLKFRKKGP
jgi:predicted methyltransferase